MPNGARNTEFKASEKPASMEDTFCSTYKTQDDWTIFLKLPYACHTAYQ